MKMVLIPLPVQAEAEKVIETRSRGVILSSRIEELGTETFTGPTDMTTMVTMRGVIVANSPNTAVPVGVPAAEAYSLARLAGKIKVMHGIVIKIVGIIRLATPNADPEKRTAVGRYSLTY